MKKIKFYVLAGIINTIAVNATAQTKNKSPYSLEITGAALLNDSKTSNYSISLYLDGQKLDSVYNRKLKPTTFYLQYNEVYTFLFQKQDCKDKIIIINTELDKGLSYIKDDTFDFEVEMSQILSKKTEDMEDYPVAVITINKKNELIEASADYNKFTHEVPNLITVPILE